MKTKEILEQIIENENCGFIIECEKCPLQKKCNADGDLKKRIEIAKSELKKLKNANDTEKINKLISDLQSLVIPEVESEINQAKISQCVELLNGAKEVLM